MASAPASAEESVGPETSIVQQQLDQLQILKERLTTGGAEAIRRPPPSLELCGTFSVVSKGIFGSNAEARSFLLVKGSGKEASQGGGAVSSIYELQSTDAKGNHERIMIQKTDELKDLDPKALEFSLVSTAEDDPVVRRFRFGSKEDFSKWAHALGLAIKGSVKRTKTGSVIQFMRAPTKPRHLSADL